MSEQDEQLGTFRGIKYNKQWLNFGGALSVIGLVIWILTTPRPGSPMIRVLAMTLGFGIIGVIYSLSPAMGQLMSGDRSWDDLSTKEQLIQLTKWAMIGAIPFMVASLIFWWVLSTIF